MTLGTCLISLAIGKTSLSYKSQEKELFADCKATVFCDYKYTTSCQLTVKEITGEKSDDS